MITIKEICAVLPRSDVRELCTLIEALLKSPPDRDYYQLIHDLGVSKGYQRYQDLRDALKED